MSKTLYAIAVFFCASIASGQWIEAPAIRAPSSGGYLGDIISRCSSPGTYMDADRVTSAHECTHGVNSDLRQRYPGCNCFYVLNGHAAVVAEPAITIGQVASAVPANERGRNFQLYLVQQRRDWDRQPLYLFDEMSAYLNGASVAYELGIADRFRDSFTSAVEFTDYGRTLLRLAPRNYDARPLRAVLAYQIKRCQLLREWSIRRGWWQ